jgi:ubiquinol-cytochrome c reductase cytochrome c1 subunit
MRHILAILLLVLSTHTWAEGPSTEDMALAKAPINQMDMESVKRGAKFFATNCLSCHTLKYLRYDKLAQEAGITYEKMPLNVKSWPYGITPPDLSLEADVRGVDWIYTYLHSFYKDPARPTGANNLLVPNSAMPAILAPYQGEQVLSKPSDNGNGIYPHTEWYDLVTLVKQGTMTSQQYDETTADVVNFLAYASAPYYAEQHHLGWWVIGFLCILLVMMYFLKVEYWKDVKKNKKD